MKKYIEVYNKVKNMILNEELKVGDKMPSVRRAVDIFQVSTTTVQNAYFCLCADGYIIAKEKSGYYISNSVKHIETSVGDKNTNKIKFDLSNSYADIESFDFTLWQRYIKNALRQGERLLTYSQAQGEPDLREAICDYIKEKRNVITSPDRIVVGAGVQALTQILCSIIENKGTVSFPNKSFVHGIKTFSDYGFKVTTRNKDADIIYVSPSHMTRWGDVMPIKRRLELVEYSKNNNSLVIEDDFENDFLYNVRPTPSLYALGDDNIVYMGSFSSMLLPGIRISFMVLTKELAKKFIENSELYAQTASKTEQIALCQFIRDGHLKSQTAKIRRLYCAKTRDFAQLLKQEIPNANVEIGENTLQIILTAPFNKDINTFEKTGLKVFIENYDGKKIVLILYPMGINANELHEAAMLLKKSLK